MKNTRKSKSPNSKKTVVSDKKQQASKDKKKTTSLQQIVKKHPHFQFLENGKICCSLTGHEMQPTKSNYDNYLKSKSYKRAIQAQFDISQYEQFLVQHKQWPKHFLYCKLTDKKVAKKKSAIQKHISGKRFQRRLEQWKSMQNGVQEEQMVDQVQEEQQDEGQEQQMKN